MRILILANTGMGLYKFRRELLEALVKKGEVFFCIPEDEYVQPIMEIGCGFIPCGLLDRRGTDPVKDLRLLWFYKKTIGRIKPDIVLTYTIKPNVYGGLVCSRLGVPYIVNITGLGTSVEAGGLLQRITLALYKVGVKKAFKVFFQNESDRDFMMARSIINGPNDVLPGSGVNLKQYKVMPYPQGNTIDFLFAARIMKEKGIEQYLNAAKVIRAEHPETRFHICGFCEQDYAEKIKKLHERGTVIYHGLVYEMTNIYNMTACTVHPTFYPEGLSNVLLESAASGRPIITTDRAGCREVVEDGVTGFVVKQQDSSDLIEKIEKFLSLSVEDRKAMGLAGRAKVEREFDRQIVVQKYMDELGKARK